MSEDAKDICEIFTDGACSGNPGPGGWGAILRVVSGEGEAGGQEKEIYGGERDTTNNRMELTAVIEALRTLKRPVKARVHTDSQYVQKGISEWIHGWKRRGWHYGGCEIIANKRTLEIWVCKGKQKNAKKMLSDAWNKADKARREFSVWQRVGLMPIETIRPFDLERAHLVIENPELKEPLNAQGRDLKDYMAGEGFNPASARVGLINDKSHGYKPEMIGNESAKGILGLDWVLCDFGNEWKEQGIKTASDFAELRAELDLAHMERGQLARALAQVLKTLREKR